MIGAFGQTYVLDWALAKRLDGVDASASIGAEQAPTLDPWTTEVGAAVGTPAYMSPEHLDARVGADPASDVWSLGAVLFFVITSPCPFEGEGAAELLATVHAAHRDGLPSSLLAGVRGSWRPSFATPCRRREANGTNLRRRSLATSRPIGPTGP